MTELVLDAFVTAIIDASDYEEMDRIYLKNRVMSRIGEEGLDAPAHQADLIALKNQLVELAVANSKIPDSMAAKDSLGAELMDWVTPSPSQVNRRFWETYRQSKEDAIADFYALSKHNDYIKVNAIAKNIAFETETPYGTIEITINLSKPEKDPKDIAAAKNAKVRHYPACQLCFENEGYQGRLDHPARANHRIIRFDMAGQEWGFQYSPYAYFNEHCIFLYSQHIPMSINRKTFDRLLTIVETFPGYFAGSNADLPIVGGSILTHEHYQGGRHTFAMELATVEESFTISGFEAVSLGIVNWPMSVLRLQSDDKAQLIELADHILESWRGYSDPAVQVLATSDGQPHHTITPIARIRDGHYELDLVLRDNQTSPEHPDGIYHPHADVQHIKKENIGLIEVMGLAILPPRLKEELKQVQDYLLGRESSVASYHQDWAADLKATHPSITDEAEAEAIVRESVGQIFARVLEDAGVYKRTAEGQAAFRRFVATL
ncbi:UDP-glucose--hexose-1-phosphate uridylyltransferase [Streptococcus sp.]|uniref:UDP-glucose--hexose-1-phosphate uridylyltransferase n=1 Tax=Streptococcus sp. TaxID=1306 RepID=UPI003993CA57